MKHYSYFLFPPVLVAIGILLLGISMYQFVFELNYSMLSDEPESLVAAIGFAFFGLMLCTFRTKFSIDPGSKLILKEYRVFGLLVSKEQIRIPVQAKRVLIKEHIKKATSHVQSVVKFGYRIKSCDMYFESEGKLVRFMNTDDERAQKIAGLIKDHLGLDCLWQAEKSEQ